MNATQTSTSPRDQRDSASLLSLRWVHQGFMFIKFIKGLGSCAGHQGYMFMWGTSGVHVHWKFIGCSCEGYQVEIHTYIHWKFIRCKSCFEVHQLYCKLTFICVQEIFARFARALSLWIILATSQLLAYGCLDKTDVDKALLRK